MDSIKGNAHFPVHGAKLTGRYGLRTLSGTNMYHYGLDFVGEGRQVYPIAQGKVIYTYNEYDPVRRWERNTQDSAGNFVIVSTVWKKQTYYVRYLHLERLCVELFERVYSDTVLGLYGDVGYSFGAHCHIDSYDEAWNICNIASIFYPDFPEFVNTLK